MSALTTPRITRTAVVAVMAGGVVAGTIGWSAAAPAAKQHTLKMVTTQIADQQIGDYDVAANKDTVGGKVVGFDTTSCRIDLQSHVARCAISVSRADGTFRGRATINLDTGVGSGTVTGGTRAFKGVTGTMTAKAISQTKTAVTITYHS